MLNNAIYAGICGVYHTANNALRRESRMEEYIETYICEKLGWIAMRGSILLGFFFNFFNLCFVHHKPSYEKGTKGTESG